MNPYIAFARKSFLNRSAYRFDHLMRILNTCLQIFIFWMIYRALYGENAEINGITLPMVTTNFILSLGLSAVFAMDDFFLPSKIWDGSVANEFIRPVSFKGRMVAESVGNALFNLIFQFAPAAVIAIIALGIELPANPVMFILFLISAILGYGVLWTISFAAQTAAFWMVNVWSLMTIKNVFINVLSGAMLPLWFMPEWMGGVLTFTPFSSIYFSPVQIYLGQLSYGEIAVKYGVAVVWILLIYILGDVLWKKGQKKLVVQGG